MSKNKQLEKAMRNFLRDIEKNNPVDYSNELTRRCVYECSKREYVAGYFNVGYSTTTQILFDVSSSPKVTKLGYEFLDTRPNWVAIITMLTSSLTAIGVLIQLILQIVKS